MAKRKREIQKRKRQQDPGTDSVHETVDTQPVPEQAGYPESSRVEVREPDPEKPRSASEPAQEWASIIDPEAVVKDTWFSRTRENLLLGLLVLYVLLLGLGTVGELFEIEWILSLGLFK